MTRVQSLVRELRPQKLHGAAKQNKKTKNKKAKAWPMEVAYLPKKYILLTFINYQNLTQAKLKSCLHRPLFKTTR